MAEMMKKNQKKNDDEIGIGDEIVEEEPPATPQPEPEAKPAPVEEKKMMPPQQDPQAMMAMMMGAKPQED